MSIATGYAKLDVELTSPKAIRLPRSSVTDVMGESALTKIPE
jgi:hypothetical protein